MVSIRLSLKVCRADFSPRDERLAFVTAPAPGSDEPGEVRPAGAIGREQHDPRRLRGRSDRFVRGGALVQSELCGAWLRALRATAPTGHRDRGLEAVGIGAPTGSTSWIVILMKAAQRHRRSREQRVRRRDGDLHAADQLDAELFRFGVRANHPVDTVAIGDRDRAQAEPMRLFHQLLGMARALEKREVRLAPEWRVAHCSSVQLSREKSQDMAG